MNKREFLQQVVAFLPAAGLLRMFPGTAEAKELVGAPTDDYDPTQHWYGMGVDVDRCIGCNRCVEACKAENGVPMTAASSQ